MFSYGLKIPKRYFLTLLTTICIILTFANNIDKLSVRSDSPFESLLEHTQALIIFLSIIYLIIKKKIFTSKFGKKFIFYWISIFSFLLYEELSFLTKGLCIYCSSHNNNNEFNLHNLNLLNATGIIKIPFLEGLTPMVLISIIFIFILSWGSYFRVFQKFKNLFVSKEYSIFTSLHIFEIFLTWFLSNVNIISNQVSILHSEYIELILYISLLFNLIDKSKKIHIKKY